MNKRVVVLCKEFGFRNPAKLCLSIPNPASVESGIQLNESETLLTIGIQNKSSTDRDWNPVPVIRNPQCGVQNPRLSWIPLHGVRAASKV